jgi:peptidoglycan hydrolase CwlO-like protein
MSRKSAWASLLVTMVLGFILTSCKDTKTMQENQQLKAQVADLQKQVGEMGNNLDTVTADRDSLKKENDALKAEVNSLKPKHAKKKTSARKRRKAATLDRLAEPSNAQDFGRYFKREAKSHEDI